MQSISCFCINDSEVIECSQKGSLKVESREKRRILEHGENKSEELYIKQINDLRFDPDISLANAWLCNVFKISKPKHALVNAVAKFFSGVLKIKYPREAYRRRKCCIYWLESILPLIMNYCFKNKVVALTAQGKKIILSVPVNGKITQPKSQSKTKNQITPKPEEPNQIKAGSQNTTMFDPFGFDDLFSQNNDNLELIFH